MGYARGMDEMLQLRAWLVDTEPEIWRMLVVDPRLTLEQLHTVLQVAFGWENSHLHQFHEEDGRRYATPNDFDSDVIDERKTLLGGVFDRKKKRIGYEYDFGDSWMHAVELETMVDPEKIEYPFETIVEGKRSVVSGKKRAAMCIGGEWNGPPEDCGGIYRFEELLKLRKKPGAAKRSAEKRHMLEWLADWEPEAFDLSVVNQELGKVRVKKAFGG